MARYEFPRFLDSMNDRLYLSRHDGATVYVVCRTGGNHGSWSVFRDGAVQRDYTTDHGGEYSYTCQCGDLAHTAGHYTNRRDAERRADELNATATA